MSVPGTRLTVLDIGDERWTRFVERVPGALPFHHPSWAQLIADCYGYRPFALVLEDGDGVAAGIPAIEIRTVLGARRWISLPFTDYSPPLARDERLMPSLLAELDAARQAKRIPRVEIRAPVAGLRVRRQPAGFVHVLQLASDPASVFRTFERSHVQQRDRESGARRRHRAPRQFEGRPDADVLRTASQDAPSSGRADPAAPVLRASVGANPCAWAADSCCWRTGTRSRSPAPYSSHGTEGSLTSTAPRARSSGSCVRTTLSSGTQFDGAARTAFTRLISDAPSPGTKASGHSSAGGGQPK